jgi:formylmethanofuran dehydrogenase subunit E
MEELIQKITDPKLRSQMERVVSFHGYLSTGAFIGLQMLNIAYRVLGLNDKERIIVTCETHNCLPDPFQILAGSTIGNKGLKINDYGKMAVTINRRGPAGSRVKSVRIMLDPAKTAEYPRLHAWFMKTAKVPHQEAVSILLDAGENVYSWEILDQEVPVKPKKIIALCEECGESFIQKDGESVCLACQGRSQATATGDDQTISNPRSEEAKCL